MKKKDNELINVLTFKGILSQEDLDKVLKEHEITGTPVQEILLNKKIISPEQLSEAIAAQYDIPYIKLSGYKIDPQIISLVPEQIAKQYKAMPVKLEDEKLYVAFVSAINLPARDEIAHITGFKISPMIATEEDINQAISRYYKVQHTSKQTLIDLRMKKLKDKEKGEDEIIDQGLLDAGDLPMVKLINDILEGAINAGASDIHFEPQHPEMIIRYRIDGILHDIMTVPRNIEESVVSRIKIMANLNITEKRLPQDGHITFKMDGRDYDLRVSTVLTVAGEKVVLRILDKDTMLISLENLGFDGDDEKIFRELISRPYGMILVTGPTGSGKTTTLYAVLKLMNSMNENIMTIENPVEYRLDRINQIQVDPSSKITFATGLRTVLRQDPDKIMVGEIRDRETSEVAVQAALTGHLVLSTLHTNDAPSAITRAMDMGIEPFLISSTVIGAIAQRLCRKICPKCKEEYVPTKEELESIGLDPSSAVKLARGKGCDYCYNTGYRGRIAIFEIMKTSDSIRDLIIRKEPVVKIKEMAVKEGMSTLKQNGIEKILNKVSTVEEVKRVVFTE